MRSKERKPAENLAEVDADIPLNETTNEPLFGIIVDGHSLVRHFSLPHFSFFPYLAHCLNMLAIF